MATRAAKDAAPSPSERQINLLRKRKYDAMHRGGDPDDKQHPKGKLTARERIELLVDPGSFTELDAFAVHRTEAFGMGEKKIPGDGVVTGYGAVDGRGYMFITGPEVIRVTTGEKVGFDELGGAQVHNIKSGVAHFLHESEAEAFAGVRRLLSYLPGSNRERPPSSRPSDDPQRRDGSLQSLIPENPHQPYDMKAAISAIVDQGSFTEVQEHFAQNLVIGFARLDGEVVGIVGNQPRILAGALDINASVKGARFVRFCDAFNIPLVTFVDVPGFLPGTAQEYNGIIRHGAKLLYAFAEATVPKLTVITRKAYGGAYDVMSSKHIGGDFNYAWPAAEIAVMGPQAAVNVIFKREIAAAKEPAKKAEQLVDDYKEKFANPYVAAERGFLDDVIEPQETRPTLIRSLHLLKDKQV